MGIGDGVRNRHGVGLTATMPDLAHRLAGGGGHASFNPLKRLATPTGLEPVLPA